MSAGAEQVRNALDAANLAAAATAELLTFVGGDGPGADSFDGAVELLLEAAKKAIEAAIPDPANPDWTQVYGAIVKALEEA